MEVGGSLPATGITLDDQLDAGCLDIASGTLLPASDPGCGYDPASGSLSGSWAQLDAGALVSCILEVPTASVGSCCNTSTVAFDQSSSERSLGPACIDVFASDRPAFNTSTKTLSPTAPGPGEEVTFTITVTNLGLDASNTGVLDSFDDCWDISAMCPNPSDCSGKVTVTPGPSGTPFLTPANRTLTVPLLDLPSGSSQTILVEGVVLAQDATSCCNQARVTAAGIAPEEQLSDDPGTGAADDPSCSQEQASGPDLLRNADWPGASKAQIFSLDEPGCPPLDPAVTLDPQGANCVRDEFGSPMDAEDDTHVLGFVSGDPDPDSGIVGELGMPLVYYLVDASPGVGNGLRAVKDGSQLRIHY